MTSIGKDIKLTLAIKFSLLFLLWFVCFKGGGHQPHKSAAERIFGISTNIAEKDLTKI